MQADEATEAGVKVGRRLVAAERKKHPKFIFLQFDNMSDYTTLVIAVYWIQRFQRVSSEQ